MIIIWIIVFIVSLGVLIKGADWLIASAEKIGLSLGLSPFIVGVTIVGVGTSFPELISSFVAIFKGVPDVVAANVIGSNIANILLIIGICAVIGKRLIVTKSLIDLDLPLLAISTVLLLGIVWDKQITFGESLLMLVTYGVYLSYTVLHKDTEEYERNSRAFTVATRKERKIYPSKTFCKRFYSFGCWHSRFGSWRKISHRCVGKFVRDVDRKSVV